MKRIASSLSLSRIPLRPISNTLLPLLGLLLVSCNQERTAAPEVGGAKIEGDKITFPAKAPQQASLHVEEAKLAPKPVIHLTGKLIWNDDITVRIFPSVAGRLDRVDAQFGQAISPGDTLATLFSPDFGQAQADASRAASELKAAERTLTRQKTLLQHGAAAEKDVEAAEEDRDTKLAERERALARLHIFGVEPGSVDGHYPLKSPLGGILVERHASPGQDVSPEQMFASDTPVGKPLFVVSDPSHLWISIDASETDISAIKQGQPLRIWSRAYPEQWFDGQVEVIGDSLDPQTRTIKVRGTVDNSKKLLKSEMYVNVELAIPAKTPASGDDSAAVPVSAIFFRKNQHYLFVENAPGEYQRTAVQIGLEHDGWATVESGIGVGQRIITEGSILLDAMLENGGTQQN